MIPQTYTSFMCKNTKPFGGCQGENDNPSGAIYDYDLHGPGIPQRIGPIIPKSIFHPFFSYFFSIDQAFFLY